MFIQPATNLNITVDGYPTEKFYINKKCLWVIFISGNPVLILLTLRNYVKAADWYRQIMETATSGTTGENYYSQYKLGWAGGFNHYVTYSRAGDASSLVYNDWLACYV
jgi:hypothetical protein